MPVACQLHVFLSKGLNLHPPSPPNKNSYHTLEIALGRELKKI